MFRRFALSSLLILTIGTGFIGCSRTQPMIQPSFEVATSNRDKVQESIRTALVNRGWAITATKPNRMEATYRRGGDLSASIAVEYSGNKVSIKHLDSQNLLYSQEAGTPMIHKNYNRWMSLLERDIQVYVGSKL